MNLVLDCDPGLDDAVAILVAAHHADLIGITTVAGNVGINRTTRNALVVTQLAGLDVPVHRGAGKPLAGEPVDGSRIHGDTGLGNAVLPDLDRSEASDDAVAYLCDTARSADDLHLLAIGPLTNVALALERDPDLRRHLAGLTIMGGSASAGNITSVAEFNVWADPEAAAIVFEKAAPVTMVGLDVTNKVVVGAEETARMRAAGTPAADLAADCTDFLRDRFRQYVGQSIVPLHDATAVIAATHPHLFERSRHPVAVEVGGEITRGMTVADLRPPALIEAIGPTGVAASDIVWDTDVDAVRELIVEAVSADGERPPPTPCPEPCLPSGSASDRRTRCGSSQEQNMTTKVVCWNINAQKEPWRCLARMAKMGEADVALLQEARMPPPPEASHLIENMPRAHWDSHAAFKKGRFKKLFGVWPMVVKLSDRVEVKWFRQVAPISDTGANEFAVSGIGTVAAARITPADGKPFIAVSMYARWIAPHLSANKKFKVGYPDGSAHRIISDLSAFIGNVDPSTHRILAAGDLNTFYGANDTPDWTAARDRTIWKRMKALGLHFLGPQAPHGRQAKPTPDFMTPHTKNVVTFHSSTKSPATADRQLDYVFASCRFHKSISTRALNSVEEWGPSDHCRLMIEVGGQEHSQP